MQAELKRRYLAFVFIAVGGLALDLATKSWIFARLGMPGESPPIWIIDGALSLETHLNEGALFGLGQGWGIVFIALSFAAAAGIAWWVFAGGAAKEWLLVVALGAITGGIFGNLYDRLGLPALAWHWRRGGHEVGEPVYAVRDWIHFQLEGLFDWPIFNIADSLLVVGVALLFWQAYVTEPRKKKESGESGE